MNREIKFRAWNKMNNTMHQFINCNDNWSFSFLNQDVFVWLEYTGLKDKNGKEIYEGDIVAYELDMEDEINNERIVIASGIAEVKYEEWAFWVDRYPACQATEVIGNIYEHPHLLNSEQSVKESDTTKAT